MELMPLQQHQDRLSLENGYAAFTYPATFTAEELADMKTWLALISRKLERQCAAHSPREEKP